MAASIGNSVFLYSCSKIMQKDHLLYILFNEYNTTVSLCEKNCNSIWSFACCIFSLSGIILNTWIAGVNQGEGSSDIPLGLKPYQLCSFFLIRLRLLACTSSSLSFCMPAVLKPVRVLSVIPRIWFLLAFTRMCNITRWVGKAAEIPGWSRCPREDEDLDGQEEAFLGLHGCH